MKITGYKINNYKSIGTDENYLTIEPKVTALIGKNESGKSNIIEAIGKLSFFTPMSKNYMSNKNRGGLGEISVITDLEFYKSELNEYNISQSKTSISFTNDSNIKIEGGFSDLLINDEALIDTIEDIFEVGIDRAIWGNDSNRLNIIQEYLEALKDISSKIFIDYSIKLDNLKRWIDNNYKDKDDLTNKLDFVKNLIERYYSLLPQIYYREKDRQLEYSYKYDDIIKILKDPNHIFYRFLLVAEINEDEIKQAFEDPIDGSKRNIQNKIERKIRSNIEERFNNFYKQEKIEFQIGFDYRVFKIYISTDDNVMDLSERSNGLRWYLSLFVDILSCDYKETSVVYLLDEPGVYLHVNAQKELLELFSRLAEKENQVIYTTHSPYMIDSSNILNVRAIEKDKNGKTRIFKNAYNQNLSKESKMETLSPLVKAIGADLKFNIGPASENNLITEGISDYMYLKALFNYLKINNSPNIIPSAGVSNINRIVSILIGWGCDFKVLLDYDKAGYEEYKALINKLDDTLKNKIIFVNCTTEIDASQIRISPKTIESLIIDDDYKKLNTPYDGTYSTKTIAAKEFYDKVVNKEIELGEGTVSNFKVLFRTLKIEY